MSQDVFLIAISLMCGTVVTLASLWLYHRVLQLRHERRVPIAFDAMQERLARIEAAVETTAVEVERISEANRFMTKLLADRTGAVNLLGKSERVITPH